MLPHMKLIVTEDAKHLQVNEFYADNPGDLRAIWQKLHRFATLHDKLEGMFWTSERIKRALSFWLIYMHNENYVLMRLGNEIAEIYVLEAADQYIRKALLSQAAEYAFKMKKENLLYMVDEDAASELEMVQSLGFVICGKYIACKTIIK